MIADMLAIIRQTAAILLSLTPFVLIGAGIGAVLLRGNSGLFPGRFSGLPVPVLVVLCSVFGTISPLCTIGTVPVVTSLIAGGLPMAAGIAFLAASSAANPQMTALTFAILGPNLALAQLFCAIAIGCISGAAVWACRGSFMPVMNRAIQQTCSHRNHSKKSFASLFLDQLQHLLPYVLLGAAAAAFINVYTPGASLTFLERNYSLSVAAGATLSVPMYVCGGGVLPSLAALMAKGVPAGAVLAFVVAGPATRIQALAALGALLNKRALAAYVVLVWLIAFISGFTFGYIL